MEHHRRPLCSTGSDDAGQRRPAARDQALRPQAPTRSGGASATDRAAEPRGRVEADARLGTGRLRQDDAAGRVAGSRSGRRTVGGVAVARPGRQRARVLLDLPDRCAADGDARGRRERARPAADAPAAADRERFSPTLLNELERAAGRHRAGARRLPRDRRARHPRRDGVPAGAPAPAGPPGDRHPRRPGAAAGPPASARRASSRSAPPTCASRPTRPPRTSTR